MVRVRAVKTEDVNEIWLDASPLLEPAVRVAGGLTDIEHVHNDLSNGRTRLLAVEDDGRLIAAVVISIHNYPLKRVLQISFAGGSRLDEWGKPGIPVVEQIAKEAGADAVHIHGRRGWLRLYKDYGYSEYSTMIMKDLRG